MLKNKQGDAPRPEELSLSIKKKEKKNINIAKVLEGGGSATLVLATSGAALVGCGSKGQEFPGGGGEGAPARPGSRFRAPILLSCLQHSPGEHEITPQSVLGYSSYCSSGAQRVLQCTLSQ